MKPSPGMKPHLVAVHIDASGLTVNTYNADLRDFEGFLGDRASRRAFMALVEDWRERLRQLGQDDPLGETPTVEFREEAGQGFVGR